MKRSFILLYLIALLCSCEKVPVGFLDAEGASIEPDSLIVKKELDLKEPTIELVKNEYWDIYLGYGYSEEQIIAWGIKEFNEIEVVGEDYYRALEKTPWISYQIQGVEGTKPLFYEVANVSEVNGGDVSELLNNIYMAGNGSIHVNIENEIPIGEYWVDVKISNIDYNHTCEKILKVIVK